jgi:hypothetical protein
MGGRLRTLSSSPPAAGPGTVVRRSKAKEKDYDEVVLLSILEPSRCLWLYAIPNQ